MLQREREQLLLWESLITEEAAGGGPLPVERCTARLLAQDPELRAFQRMPPAEQARERFFMGNSIKGYLGGIEEHPQGAGKDR
jgi:hypothetical protein